jgi:tetratricopeptide (TPR) repeat protein
MIRYLTIGMICMTAATVVLADQLIDTRGLPYEGSLTGYRARTLNFRATNIGREKSYPLAQIRSLKIDGFDAFNQAEDLAGKKKYNEAVAAYDKALRSAPTDRAWIKTLVADRRYQACAKAGRIDEALKEWLTMMDADPNDKIIQALMPETFAPEGDPANAEAVKLLDAKLAQLQKDPKSENYTRRLLKLKMKLLEAMGEEEKATAAAQAVTQLNAPAADKTAPDAPEDEEEESQAPAPAMSDLDVLARLVEAGKYDDVIEKLAPRMQTLPRNDLSGPLFLLAKAQWLKYQADEPKDQKLLLRAGLNLMWVYSAYGNSDEAPEALFLAAQLHRAMNDPAAARRALEELVEQFGGAEDNPWVSKAQDMLEGDENTE